MTPTDVAGWIGLAPAALVALLIIIAAAALLEGTERGIRWTERVIELVLR
jgi:hypothetical protein